MTEQELNKACAWIANMPIEYSEFIEKGHCNWIADDFRKAMTTKKNPLFEKCLANVNPNTRAEVRRNMDYLQSKIDAFSEARKKDGKTADEMLDECRGGALELTWQDMAKIADIIGHTSRLTRDGITRSPEEFYKEVLSKFKEQ